MRRTWLLFALVALIALASAINVEEFRIDGVEAYLHHGERRQATGTGNSDPPEPTESSPPPPEDPEDPPETSAPPPPETTTPPPPPPPSQTPSRSPPPSSQQPTDRPDEPTETPSSSAAPPPSRTSPATTPIVRTTPLVSTNVQEFTTVIKTVTNGQTMDVTSTGQRTDVFTTGQAVSTEMPLPQNGDGDSGSGGLSDSNKKIIGGVVGGVGGAILLGGIAIVLWRVYGRKNRVSEDDDDIMANTGAALGDKPTSSGTGQSPFQSHLEQYHNPGGRPNAAANF
ncbi:hypothetical protein M011DRAFT_412659 [Sporormia fimetaria CBS 119925]|uniref:Mid2 domain-containing protein n=1 Tax=Sporormia fimetaria CBS 119925 TaxID=1340428 RepID=A0A6A6UZK4_9PLEO|nr:hypothetical protein M011DRAFT_412659 [Sporormia fimetaria CBS 119925]